MGEQQLYCFTSPYADRNLGLLQSVPCTLLPLALLHRLAQDKDRGVPRKVWVKKLSKLKGACVSLPVA